MNNNCFDNKIKKNLDCGKKCNCTPIIVGPTGPTGPQGPVSIDVGVTTTTDPGTNASVTNVGTDDVKENNSNVVTFDDILNGRIPVNYYENVLSVDEHDIVNPQEVFENKYKEYKEKSNIESFQDIVNDANEDKVVIIKNNKAKDNLRINTVTLDSLEDKNDTVDTMVTSESSGNENISEVTNELDNTGKIDVVTSNEEIRKDSYSLDDYKKFIAMLGELKDFTNSNNVSIDDAVTISLINNYSIDDCLKFKEILESNLN